MPGERPERPWEERREEIRRYFEEAMGKEPISVASLERYNPDALEAFYLLRKATLKEPPEGTLSKKVQELIIIAVEAALKKDPVGHARIAVDAGATPQEIHDAVGIVLWLAGMPAYHHGMRAVKAAEDYLLEKGSAAAVR
ncbi:MAG TPA: carboxymuconolactone decarboxylase family protein [Trueperaceae bacterium]|jgi:alkylhydroperoxidase/carboxymuconolactone decarboxylase family protein YurZ